MSFADREEIRRRRAGAGALPAEVSWEMLDKSRFFVLGAALFSGVSAALYPAVVLKTHLQVAPSAPSAPAPRPLATLVSILRASGLPGLYRGFPTSLAGTVPARAVYMLTLESTKSLSFASALRLGLPDPLAAASASALAGLAAALAAQLVWTPVDVISQRLMVGEQRYNSGLDCCKKILKSHGLSGLYRGFGVSILTYAPSNAVWWGSYSLSQRLIWKLLGQNGRDSNSRSNGEGYDMRGDCRVLMGVQGVSAAMAGGAAAVVTMPLDTVKTRIQVMDGGDSFGRMMKDLVREEGFRACFRGLGPRWASMSLSAATMITTYEFVKRLSAKDVACEHG